MESQQHMLLFAAGGHRCAVPVAHVAETLRPLPVERLAALPDFVLGLSRIRGASVPVVDAGLLLGGGPAASGRFLLLRVAERSVALAVESVAGVRLLPGAALQAPPPLLGEAGRTLIAAVGAADSEFLLVLQTVRLLAAMPEMEAAHA